MKVIVSASVPKLALTQLEKQFDVVLFHTEGLTYPAISDHPDVFLSPMENGFIGAPNLPEKTKDGFLDAGIEWIEGKYPVGMKYPESARYNAVIAESFFIHQHQFTDPFLLHFHKEKTQIHVNQAYTRCNLLPLRNNCFITSDKGIEKALVNHGLKAHYVNPQGILLPGFQHGFFGGTCGIAGNTVYFLGHLQHHPQGKSIRAWFEALEYDICCLYDGPLFDGGSLFFV